METDEQLLHRFYTDGAVDALEEFLDRHGPLFVRIAFLIIRTRTGCDVQALGEWDINDILDEVSAHVLLTRMAGAARWPHERLSALSWLVHLLCLELDRRLGLRPPF